MANEFFTLTSMGTLAGATGATVTVTNALKTAFGWNPKWLGLLIAEIVCITVLFATGTTHLSDWFIGILNGFLVFTTAAGATSVGGAVTGAGATTANSGASARSGNINAQGATITAAEKRKFWSPWF